MKQASANIPFLISQVNDLIAGMLLRTAGLFAFILLKLGGLVGIGFGYAVTTLTPQAAGQNVTLLPSCLSF